MTNQNSLDLSFDVKRGMRKTAAGGGVSKEQVSDDILSLLGVTANHVKKEGNIDLKVIMSN